jgi:hypothetical protein
VNCESAQARAARCAAARYVSGKIGAQLRSHLNGTNEKWLKARAVKAAEKRENMLLGVTGRSGLGEMSQPYAFGGH